jgi:hypothetical protein
MSLSKILTSLTAGTFSGSQLDDLDVKDDSGALWTRIFGGGPAAPGASVSVTQAESVTFATGQQAVTGTAAKLNGGTATSWGNGFRLKCLSTSTASLFYGPSGVTTSTGDELAPGESVVLPMSDISSVYVIAVSASTATASWVGLV